MMAMYCRYVAFQVGPSCLLPISMDNQLAKHYSFSALISVPYRPNLYSNIENCFKLVGNVYVICLMSSDVHCRYSFIKYLPPLTKELSNRSPGKG